MASETFTRAFASRRRYEPQTADARAWLLGIATVFNVDGFGTREAKTNRYNDLTSDPERPQFVFTGFKLFYEEDTRNNGRIMNWSEVLDLDPQPDVVVYE